jgi:type I restriction enzyme R subunit
LYENTKKAQKPDGDGKGGTYFGATGCGKSFAMLIFMPELRREPINY